MRKILPLCIFACLLPSLAQAAIYRCGNEYSNTRQKIVSTNQNCKLVEIDETPEPVVLKAEAKDNQTQSKTTESKPNETKTVTNATADMNKGTKIDPEVQKGRNKEALMIMNDELKKYKSKQAELQKEYNNGAPEKIGDETKNNQKYLDRVALLKSALTRIENDIAGISREIERITPKN